MKRLGTISSLMIYYGKSSQNPDESAFGSIFLLLSFLFFSLCFVPPKPCDCLFISLRLSPGSDNCGKRKLCKMNVNCFCLNCCIFSAQSCSFASGYCSDSTWFYSSPTTTVTSTIVIHSSSFIIYSCHH